LNKELISALKELEKEKGIDIDTIIEALQIALVSAYKKNYKITYNTKVDIDFNSGEIKVLRLLEGEEAKEAGVDEIDVTPENFGRIAAQTAKQVITQKIKEAEREVMYNEFRDRVSDMVIGIIQQNDSRYTLVDLGKVEALLPLSEQVPGERYKHGERIKCYISEVLFELEVPEIYEGIVEIKNVAREAGFRTKIAVSSNEKNVDAVGACVGPKGSRVRMVVEELAGEKIDIVQYSDDIVVFIKNALSPARVLKVLTDEEKKFALVVVPNDQLSLAIGKDGQNARLAAKLTNWKIDIKSEMQYEEELNKARKERKKAT